MIKILAFSGSTRCGSFNQKLVQIAALGAKQAGVDTTVINLANYNMPIFNEDLEKKIGFPEKVYEFKKLLIEHNGFLIASPEHNSAFSSLLKNVIDWSSCSETKREPPLLAYKGKIAGIMAASTGKSGGVIGLTFLRMLLTNIGVMVLDNQLAIANSYEAFGDDGNLLDAQQQQAVIDLGAELVKSLKNKYLLK